MRVETLGWRLVLITLLALASACSSATLTPVDWCVADSRLRCETAARCCAVPELASMASSLAQCADPATEDARRRICQSFYDGVYDDRVRFDPAAARADLDARSSAAETCAVPGPRAPVFELLMSGEGTICGLGLPGWWSFLICSSDGSYCQGSICTAPAAVGEYCDTAVFCAGNAYCAASTCVPAIAPGADCSSGGLCQPGYRCDDLGSGTCVPSVLAVDGAGCAVSAECASGRCVSGSCRTLSASDDYYCPST